MFQSFKLAGLLIVLSSALEAAPEGHLFFEEKVRPILAEHCLKCHSEEKKIKGGLLLDRKAGWEKGGDSGTVIVPGKPDKSLLMHMVRREADYESMPPKSKLSDEEVAILGEWIAKGAPDPRDEAIGAQAPDDGFDLEARKGWWSLQPVKKVDVPGVKNPEWARNDFDLFLLAKLDEKGWKPAEEAPAEQVFRRASVILTGLSPTPEDLTEFRADQEEGAYERAVDRLLASEHFGEQWARHWMDVVRYAETKAFEADYTMAYTWRYRDYLIRAFNEDVPFDQFTREAFAGDLLETSRLDPKTGFNESVIGPGFFLFTDGQHGPTDLHEDEARIFDGMIKTVGTAFHGLTIACARCHDHKFDAITDEDYYSLYGTLKSSRLHYANIAEALWNDERQRQLEKAGAEVTKATLASARSQLGHLPKTIARVRALAASDELRKTRELLSKLKAPERTKKLAVIRRDLTEREGAEVATWFLYFAMENDQELKGLRHWLQHGKEIPKGEAIGPKFEYQWIASGAGFSSVEKGAFILNPDTPQVIVSGVGQGHVAGNLSARLDGTIRSQDFTLDGSPVEFWVKGKGAVAVLVIRNFELAGAGPTTSVLRKPITSDQWIKVRYPTTLWKGETAFLEVRHQGDLKTHLRGAQAPGSPSDLAWVAVSNSLPNWNEAWQGETLLDERIGNLLSRSDLSPAEHEVLGGLFSKGLLKVDQGDPAFAAMKALRQAIDPPVYVRSLVDGDEHHEPIYIRGSHKSLSKAPNPRHFLDGLGGDRLSETGSGRLAWAEKVLAPENPLTARVRANRIWARVFGRGIVGSVDDFGKMGELPSHPELLDFLARDFVEERWSTKKLLRKLLTSSAFRMSSVPDSLSAQLDPDNKLLQHMPIRRMDAESIRDHILASSGTLKNDLYGRGVLPYVKDQPNSRAKPPTGPLDGEGRRSIYIQVRRNFLPSFLRAFDFPPSTEPVGQRPITTVPAQSLALLNHPLVHEQSRKWAERILKSEVSVEDRIKLLHRQAFAREARADEIIWAFGALEKFDVSVDQTAAWSSLCHLMMNRKEFLYVF